MASHTSSSNYSLIRSGVVFLLLVAPGFAQSQTDPTFDNPPNTQALDIPMTPADEALRMMDLPSGFKSTLFAAEPDIHQPIAVTTDSRGRLWVAECYTYSDRKENYNTELNDRIVIFEDVDQDGVFDKKKVFWDQGKKLTSLEIGFGGVYVTSAPNLMFIPDADQDDIPDGDPEILLDGFEGNVIRHNIVNGLRWGPDGWLYGRHGIQATSLVGPPGATDSQRTPLNCSIWRYHPTLHRFEIVARGGTNPWGFDYDEHGEMFMINTVIGHLFHIVPNARYRRMYGTHFNPHLYQVIEQTADHFHWDVSEEHWAVTKKDGMSDGTDKAGGGHAHTGLMIYQGNNWPKEFYNKLFTANFHGRRINSDSIQRQGNSYVAHHGPDYFRTKDPWFRGVELIYGPDGGVFVLDWSDIGECHENDGIHRTSGRIFKLTYGTPKPPRHPDLRTLSNVQLIELLGDANQWYPRKARRLLQERVHHLQLKQLTPNLEPAQQLALQQQVDSIANELKSAYVNASDTKHQLRLMWALYSIDPPDQSWLIEQTQSKDEHIRSWAVRMLADGQVPITNDIASCFANLAKSDTSGLVRLYVASSLQRFNADQVFEIAQQLMSHASDAEDRVQPKLIWYGIEPHIMKQPERAIQLALRSQMPLVNSNIARRITNAIEVQPEAVAQLFAQIATTTNRSRQLNLLDGTVLALKGWNRTTPPKNWEAVSAKIQKLSSRELNERLQSLSIVFGDGRALDELRKIAIDNSADVTIRRNAILALADSGQTEGLFKLLKPLITDKSLTTVVTRAMAKCDRADVARVILNRFPHMDPAGKTAAINTLVIRATWAKQLLDAIAKQRVPVEAITASHARQIQNFQDEAITKRLTQVWGQIRETSAERQQQIDELRERLNATESNAINLENGQMLFEKNCANCHILFGNGGRIGPDLTGSDRKNLNYLLENIVDPSASVAEGFRTSVIAMEDGRLFTGVILETTERILTVQTKDEIVKLDRTLIEKMRTTKNSLMPEGLVDKLTEQEVADLFGFLRN